jgi:hypothetical protein
MGVNEWISKMLNFEPKFLNKERICYEFPKLPVVDQLYWPIES